MDEKNPVTTVLIVVAVASSIFVVIGMVQSDSIQWESMHWTFYVGLWSLALSTLAIMICQCDHGEGGARSYSGPPPGRRRDPLIGPWAGFRPNRAGFRPDRLSYHPYLSKTSYRK